MDGISIWQGFQATSLWIKAIAIAAAVAFTSVVVLSAKPFGVICKNVISTGWQQVISKNSGLFLVVEDFRVVPDISEAIAQWKVISLRFKDVLVDAVELSIIFTGVDEPLKFHPSRSFVVRNLAETSMYTSRAKLPSAWSQRIKEGHVLKFFGTLTGSCLNKVIFAVKQEFWAKLN